MKQFVLPRSNPHYCAKSAQGTRLPLPVAPDAECQLYLSVSGFEDGDYQLAVYPYNQSVDPQAMATSGGGGTAWSCSPGCDEQTLGNTRCDLACNTSACLWDQGDCGYYGELPRDEICSTGCPLEWTADGYCDEVSSAPPAPPPALLCSCRYRCRHHGARAPASTLLTFLQACFNAQCEWDQGDCTSAPSGCADGCLIVHRHSNPEMSKAELKALQKEKQAAKNAARAAAREA